MPEWWNRLRGKETTSPQSSQEQPDRGEEISPAIAAYTAQRERSFKQAPGAWESIKNDIFWENAVQEIGRRLAQDKIIITPEQITLHLLGYLQQKVNPELQVDQITEALVTLSRGVTSDNLEEFLDDLYTSIKNSLTTSY